MYAYFSRLFLSFGVTQPRQGGGYREEGSSVQGWWSLSPARGARLPGTDPHTPVGGRGEGWGSRGPLAAPQTRTPRNLGKEGPGSTSLIYSGASPETLMKNTDPQSFPRWAGSGEPLGASLGFFPAAHPQPAVQAGCTPLPPGGGWAKLQVRHLPPWSPQGLCSRNQPSHAHTRTRPSGPQPPPGVSRAS